MSNNQSQPESRRKFLAGAGLWTTGVVSAAAVGSLAKPAASAEGDPTPPTWPWTYKPLVPEDSAKAGYDGYYAGGCCYGAAQGILGQMAQQYGYPYNFIPTDMFRYGEGGGAGWGTLCGALNGAMASVNLFCNKAAYDKILNELMAWYTQTALPIYVPAGKEVIVKSQSDSPLCHASVSNWCHMAKFGVTSAERKERCARLVADVVTKTVTMLNQNLDSTFTPVLTPAASVSSCMACHGSTALNNTLGKMDCTECHDVHTTPSTLNGWNKF